MAPTRGLRDLVSDAARALGRQPSVALPYADTLADNWFDTPESLADSRPEELVALGIPLRFAQQLVNLASGGGKGGCGREQGKGQGGGRPAAPDRDGGGRQGKGGGGSKILNVRHMDSQFRARGSILGQKGRNVHHIQDETGVKVDLKGDSDLDEKLELVFSDPPSGDALRQAMQMGKDLLQSVYGEYDNWVKGGKPDQRKGDGRGGQGKGGGKGGPRKDNSEKLAEAEFQHAIELADCDPGFSVRGKLLGKQGRNVREIEAKTGAMLQLKGDAGEQMRLELGADSPEVLQQAQEMAEDLVTRIYADYDQWIAEGGASGEQESKGDREQENMGGRQRGQKRKPQGKVADCEFSTTLELQDHDPNYSLRGKVLGAGGRKLKKIEEDTGAAFDLQGRDGEPLSLLIGASSQEVLDLATKAAEDLLADVYSDYQVWQDNGGTDNRREAGKNQRKGGVAKGSGKSAGDFKKVLKLKECDAEFNLRAQLRGNKCENLHHIQDETRSRLWVLGELDDPVRLEISAHNAKDLEEGTRMAKDLIKTIFNDYAQWCKQRGGAGNSKRPRVA